MASSVSEVLQKNIVVMAFSPLDKNILVVAVDSIKALVIIVVTLKYYSVNNGASSAN
jgi:hypothetical protein